MNTYYVYIITNKHKIVFYIGVTNNLNRRIIEHKENRGSSFSKRYNINFLVYYEGFSLIDDAIKREKQLKKMET